MKRRIIFSFLLVFAIALLGATFAYVNVSRTNRMLSELINLHQIENLRQQLIRSIQTVQSDLYTIRTDLGGKLDSIIEDVSKLDHAGDICVSCHHDPEVGQRLEAVHALINNYQDSLSFYITASANAEQIKVNKTEAALIGNKLLAETEAMSIMAGNRLKARTTVAVQQMERVTFILMITMLIALVVGIVVTAYLTRAITRPIDALLNATRMIAAGKLGYTVDYRDTTEFGELATHFNSMSTSLQSGYAKLEEEISERKKSAKALSDSEERYALAAQGSNDGLWDWDLRNNEIHFSSRWKAMLGYADDDIGDQPDEWLGRVHPDDRPEAEARIAAHISGRNHHFENEFRIKHKNGSYLWMLSRGLAVRDATGRAYRMAGSQTDITAAKAASEQLVYNAFHDGLTGLPNRALFTNRLQHVITTSARRSEVLYGVLFLDTDRFKIINDSLGHIVGDQLLKVLGVKLGECIRPGDTVARLGGDEFSVLLEDITDLKDAVDVADRIHQQLAAPLMIDGHEVYAAVSVGIALGTPQYERAEQVLRDADIAMYEAKKRGGACSEIFDARMHAGIVDRIELESELRGVLDRNELSLVYQPQIDLRKFRLVGFEALVRWNHPARGQVSPVEFIPLAEETGMIVKIGEWILRETCRELSRLQKHFPCDPPLEMSVNISSRQLMQEDLAATVLRIVEEEGVAPASLSIEITESMLMANVDIAVGTMQILRAKGVHIHIDDFGTGYSSLSYLHSLPIDTLKIDQSFVSKLTTEGDNQEIVLSIMSLAKSLNFNVIAEGIEHDHQLQQLQGLDCPVGQGYLFSKPMKPDVLHAWMRARESTVAHTPQPPGLKRRLQDCVGQSATG